MSSEDQEFAAFVANATASAPTATPKPAETPTEAAKPAEAEAKPAAEVKTEPKTDWEEAARKERERRAARVRANAEVAAKDQIIADLRARAARLDVIDEKKTKSKLEALKETGMTLDELNDEYLKTLDADGSKPTAAQEAFATKLAEVQAELAALKRDKDEASQREAQAKEEHTLNSIRASIGDAIKTKPEEYELLGQDQQGSEIVFNLLVAHANETAIRNKDGAIIQPGEMLDIQVACARVEAKLLAKAIARAESKKVQAALAKKSGSTTLSSDMREPQPNGASTSGDENQDFLKLATTLNQQVA